MKDLINPDFVFIDECETIADYIETHLYDTVHWQLPSPASPLDPDHDEDMEHHLQVNTNSKSLDPEKAS